ncbi:MAD2L1-binding protein-like [Cheilinus undulatus]|uniref:MAD2L1-binding protein-like n=1 Tax=Cheilinus undulatus TaxID=241271 RepID=UPI001BD69C3B|nr:MAD2L1-binding protein-like [Cheilinus undulatus]
MFSWDMNAALRRSTFPMMRCGTHPAGTFKNMAEDSMIFKTVSGSEDANMKLVLNNEESKTRRRLSFTTEHNGSKQEDPDVSCKVLTLQNVPEDFSSCRISAETTEQLSPQTAVNSCLKTKNTIEVTDISSEPKRKSINITEEKENATIPTTSSTTDDTKEESKSAQKSLQDSCKIACQQQQSNTEESDAEVLRRAQEEGHVSVVFPGTVTQDGCCRFVSEILKCILYQRQQLPMTYEQLVYSQKKQQASMQDKDIVSRRPVQSADMDWRKCQQTLQELEEVLQQLEVLFSLSSVPRVLLLLGGSLVFPKELYEINMENLEVASGDQCLRVSSCLRQLFRTLFIADILSDSKPVRLMPTTVLVLAHRDCGTGWFRPKLQFKVPTRVKNQVIALSSDPNTCRNQRAEGSDLKDYVWFQAPVTIKGFRK